MPKVNMNIFSESPIIGKTFSHILPLTSFVPHRNVEKRNHRLYELFFHSKKKLGTTVTRYEWAEPNEYQSRQGVFQVLRLNEGFGNPPPPLLEVIFTLLFLFS